MSAALACDQHPDAATARQLGAIAAAWSRFASLNYTHPVGSGALSTARISHGCGTLGTARGKTPRAACTNLLRKLLAAGVQVPS